jgi:hypothetical protein
VTYDHVAVCMTQQHHRKISEDCKSRPENKNGARPWKLTIVINGPSLLRPEHSPDGLCLKNLRKVAKYPYATDVPMFV